MQASTRRQFLGDISYGMLLAGLGPSLAAQLTAAEPLARARSLRPLGGDLEKLIARMQELPADELLPLLIAELRSGTKLDVLVTAGGLANARTFCGGDYEGFHAFMALLPALAMAQQMPKGQEPLPVLKVLYRSTARIRTAGGGRKAQEEVAADASAGEGPGLVQRIRAGDLPGAESALARSVGQDPARAYGELQPLVRDDIDVHRIVLAWRAWDMLAIAGREHAQELLRQIVRYCNDSERNRIKRGNPAPAVREEVPAIFERHGLLSKRPGDRQPDDAWLEGMVRTVFASDRAHAAEAVAEALAAGFAPEAVGEAISLAANQLLLHDTGKNRVHGASTGVHASDAANAWRNVARTEAAGASMASLVLAAYHTAGQSGNVGKDPYPFQEQLEKLQTSEPEALLRAASAAIEQRDQPGACAAMQRYGALGHPAAPAFALLLGYAVSQDGALHAEKYFHTVREEFERTRPAFRWRRMVALARVTASEYGEPAPGVAEARRQLGV
jgi:hypothetical protein